MSENMNERIMWIPRYELVLVESQYEKDVKSEYAGFIEPYSTGYKTGLKIYIETIGEAEQVCDRCTELEYSHFDDGDPNSEEA